jgi:Mn2+/Fe2+ NRAMP family transporter
MKNRLLNILFWSVLSAAFIGPGTITTAASAGADYQYTLLWALLFSVIACTILQEAAARLTLASGQNLGQTIFQRFQNSLAGRSLAYLVLISIVLGCVAYEAGNILGAVAGAALLIDISIPILTLIIGSSCIVLMWFASARQIAQLLGGVVAIMGLCFLTTAILKQPSLSKLFSGLAVPSMPGGSELLVIGLIGTTIVPYNLFLGSGLAHTQNLKEMRISLTSAIVLGGVVSMAVLVVGSSVQGEFTYEALSQIMAVELGGWASTFFGVGLCAAGFSSALTAPLAASLTAESILGYRNPQKWDSKSVRFRAVWLLVLVTGIIFGVLQVQPIPAIILAQAFNGIILPFVAIFLWLMINNAELLGKSQINSASGNTSMGLVVFITLILGLTNIAQALTKLFAIEIVNQNIIAIGSVAVALLVYWPVIKTILIYRKK